MNFNKTLKFADYWISLILILFLCASCSTPNKSKDTKLVERLPKIQPDYSEIMIPPNIAPLNFFIKETGEEYLVQIHSKKGEPIEIRNSTGIIQIPIKQWKNLLLENLGQDLMVDISLRTYNGEWIRFNSIINQIAYESIDGYLAFRRFKPIFNLWQKMGIFQRCLENFEEQTVLINRLTEDGCMNCHNFFQNKTDKWLLHLRGGAGTSMLLVTDGKARKVITKTKFNGHVAYPAWHPSGELIAFSVSSLILFFHEVGECRDVLDLHSDMVLYDIPTNTITTTPQISDSNRMEIWPAWSPDGKFLYFCSAPKLDSIIAVEKIKYDLMRIAYDPIKRTWGNLETVISSSEIGLSITEPRVSPDGHFVLFTAAEYSQFPIYLPSADLYLLDIKSGQWKKLEVNSDKADSFHSWSSNGRWIVFSSKRQDGLLTRPFFSHIDSMGNTSKPFILPQEDPLVYEKSLEVYNVPEFIQEPVRVSPQTLAKAAYSDAIPAQLDPLVIQRLNTEKTTSFQNKPSQPME